MEITGLKKIIQREMNRRRHYGGAEDVPAFFWENSEVASAMYRAAACAQREEFTGDWDEAPTSLEEAMDALATALRKASMKRSSFLPLIEGARETLRRSMSASQQMTQEQEEHKKERYPYFPYFPSVVRQDVGGQALADYLTWHWQNHGWSACIRKEVCGGEYLSREDAWEFLTSSLPKVLGYDDYQRLGLCPARTKGRILSKYLIIDGLLFMSNMVMADPKTHDITATTDTLFNEIGHYCVEISMPHNHTTTRRLKRLVLNLDEDRYHYISSRSTLPGSYEVEFGHGRDSFSAPHPAPYFQGRSRYVEGYATSVMADLIGIAEMFCGQYSVSIWDMLEACLTGRFPPQPAVTLSPYQSVIISDDGPDELRSDKVRTGFSAQGPATLTVRPWVTPEVLADAWREHRQSNSSYSPSEKQADALRFVLSHTEPGTDFAWDKMAVQWEAERGEPMSRGQLYKQFQRARAAILPGYCDLEER